MREIDNHSGEEAAFGEAEQEARGVELGGVVHKTCPGRDQAPRNHDPRNPLSRAPTFNDDCPRNLEKDITDEEHAHAQSVNAVTEAEVGAHSEIRKRDVDAIQISNYVEQEN